MSALNHIKHCYIRYKKNFYGLSPLNHLKHCYIKIQEEYSCYTAIPYKTLLHKIQEQLLRYFTTEQYKTLI